MKTYRTPVLLGASLLTNMGIGLLNFGLLFFLKDNFGTSPAQLGWINSIWAAAYIVGCILLSRLSKWLKAPRSLITASFLMAVSSLIILTIHVEAVIIGSYIFFGFITALFWPPVMGWLSTGYEGSELNRVLGFFNLSWSSGVAVAPYIGGLLLTLGLDLPLRLAFGVYALIFLVMLVSYFKMPGFLPESPEPQKEQAEITDIKAAAVKSDNSTPLRFLGWTGVLSAYILYGALTFIFPLYGRDVLGFSEPLVGFLLFIRAIASVSGFWYTRKSSWWHFNSLQILIVQILMAICGIVFVFFQHPLALGISFVIFGFLFAIQYSNSIFHGVAGSVHRESRMAIHESLLTAGLIIGAAGGGYLYEVYSMDTAFLSCAGVIGIGFFCQLIFLFFIFNAKRPIHKENF